MAGWGVAVYDADMNLLGGWYGAVPPSILPQQVARDGKDSAVSMAVRFIAGTLSLYTVCASTLACVVDRGTATRPSKTRAHSWAKIFGEEGLGRISPKKCPATLLCTTRGKEG